VACNTRRADDWHGYGWRHNGKHYVHCSGLRWRSSYDYGVHGHVHTGMCNGYGGIIAHHGEWPDERNCIHLQSQGAKRHWLWCVQRRV
jgi:hypothetical protein